MSGKTDQMKGRIKEALGPLGRDKHLEHEGEFDRAAGNLKEKAGAVARDVREKTRELVDKVKSTIKR